MELPSGPFVYGRLRGLGGVPHDAVVTARRLLQEPELRQFKQPEWDMTRAERDRKGYYGLSGLLPDLYIVRAEAPGFGSVETILDLRDGYEGRMDLRLRKGHADRVEDAELLTRLPPVVESGADVEEDDRDQATVVTIDATREGGEMPLPGVFVRFFEGEMEFTSPMSFREDKFELVGLPEGTYSSIRILVSGYMKWGTSK